MTRIPYLVAVFLLVFWIRPTLGIDAEVLKPRVPAHLIEEARHWKNPLEATPDNIEKGKGLFQGKAFCATCHGRDGRGMADIAGLRGILPRNFTDQAWQAATPITDFVMKDPVENAQPTDPMEVRFVYDDDALYVGARMFAKDLRSIQAPIGRRDNIGQMEHLIVALDT